MNNSKEAKLIAFKQTIQELHHYSNDTEYQSAIHMLRFGAAIHLQNVLKTVVNRSNMFGTEPKRQLH